MHSRTKALSLLSLVVVLCVALPAAAQQMTHKADNDSHRFLPPGQPPTKRDLQGSDYTKALDQYRKLSRTRNRQASTPPSFDPAPFNPDETERAQIDPELLKQLNPDDSRWLRRTTRQTMSDLAKEIENNVANLNEQFRRQLGMPADENVEPTKKFELPEEVLSPYEQARKTWRDQQKKLSEDYKQALEDFNGQWPSEKIPPDQWVQKVQPFINSEVLEQLRQYRAYEEGMTDKLPESAFQKLPTSPVNRGFSGRMLESVVKTLDSGTNELIKRAKENKRSGKKESSLWKRLKAAATKQIESTNRTITKRTEQYANTQRVNRPQPRRTSTRTTTTSSNSSLAKIAGVIAFVLGVAALIAYLLHLKKLHDSDADYSAPISLDSIRDRESMLRAIHSAAADRFGRTSRYWHHRKLFSEIEEIAEERRPEELPVLASLYERARYAPNGEVSSDDLEVARRWYKEFRKTELLKS